MDGATHLVLGAVAGEMFGRDPLSKFAAGVISHLVADAFPHYDPDPRKPEALPYYLWAAQVVAGINRMERDGGEGMLAGALGGWLPDLEHVLHYFGVQREKVFPTHVGPQFEPYLQLKLPKALGVPVTALINLAGIGYLYHRSRKRMTKRKKRFFFSR